MTRRSRTFGVLALGVLLTTGVATAVASGGASATAPTTPVVRMVSPANGPMAGGTFVTISGSRFDGATAVSFGPTPAPTGWFVRNPGTIEAVAPPFAGTSSVVVTVTTPAGTSSTTATATDVFNYVTGPTIQNVGPDTGPVQGGTIVTIAGTGFTGVTGVTFGGVAATAYTVDSATEITATVPSSGGASVVNVAVATSGGTTPVDPAARYFYEANPPTVTSVSASSGPIGTTVTIKGTHFLKATQGVMTVDFGSAPATIVLQKSASQIKVIAPDGSGTVDVTVSDSNGTSNINEPADYFTYTP